MSHAARNDKYAITHWLDEVYANLEYVETCEVFTAN